MPEWEHAHTDWFHAARWGVFCHYLGGSGNEANDGDEWNQRVDAQGTAGVADVPLTLRTAPGQALTLVVERAGDPRQARYKVPVCVEFGVPELPALPELGQVAAALAEFAPRPAVTANGQTVGRVRLACAGESLLLTAEVVDVKLTTTVTLRSQSCKTCFAWAFPESRSPRPSAIRGG